MVNLCVNVGFDQISFEVNEYLLTKSSSLSFSRSEINFVRYPSGSEASGQLPKLSDAASVSEFSGVSENKHGSQTVSHSEWALEGVDVSMCTDIT